MDNGFELIPAIDLKDGKCVRLQEGDLSCATEYSNDPVATALRWQELGAQRLHVVDLDGAFSGGSAHRELMRSIIRELRIPIQFGGGLRTLEQIGGILELGAGRAILGTVAVERPEIVAEAVKRFGGAIIVGIDARGRRAAVRGWVQQSTLSASCLAVRMKDLGVARLIYTDVSRDGTMRGANIEETEQLARAAGIPVIASGGISGPTDVKALWERRRAGIEGVILGKALYEGRLDFRDLAARAAAWS